jgi:ABC-type lipoprotein export system ATPase subunit
MIRLRGVRKNYTTNKVVNEVLKGIDLDIGAGEFVAIVGRSGSGKTTLLNIVGALDSQYEGSVEVDGRQLRDLDDTAVSSYRNQNVGFIFQSFYLLEHMTCLENVALPSSFARDDRVLTRPAALARAREVMEQVELSEKCDALPNTLSGGQKQRVAIARALGGGPPVILGDEPTAAVDSKTALGIMELLHGLARQQGRAVVVVTHDHRLERYADRVVEVEDGRVSGGRPGAGPAGPGPAERWS